MRRWPFIFIVLLLAFSVSAMTRPTAYGTVPRCQPFPLANAAGFSFASAWRGCWADITGFYNIGLRPYDPVSGRWLTFDSVWNEIDASGMTFCGGDPVNRFDPDGRLSSVGSDNGVNNLYLNVAPVMQSYLETTTYMLNGTSFSTGSPGEPTAVMVSPDQVAGNSYNIVRQPTDQWGLFVSSSQPPADYWNTTSTPITKYDVEMQQDKQFLLGTAVVLGTMLTDTEGAAPEMLAAESGTIDTSLVRFSQNSISGTFKNGGTIEDIAANLNGPNGEALASQIPPIRLVQQDGLLYTLDNRRLAAFSMTDLQVPYRMATPAEISAEWGSKFTTTAQQGWGQFITV